MTKLSGQVIQIFDLTKFTSQNGKNFEKRIFFLKETNTQYPNTWSIEFWNDDCKMGDILNEGDLITCFIDIKGKAFQKKDGSGEFVTNTLKCWNIEKDGKTFKDINKEQQLFCKITSKTYIIL